MDVRFKSFAFPTPAILRQTTHSFNMKRLDRATFKALIEVIQNGVCVADAEVPYALFESTVLASKETEWPVIQRPNIPHTTASGCGLTRRSIHA
ncbi:MAG: hypothetical protein ACI9W6_002444 [Motiliproteus sp.]|jgi:hypothetical protein